MLPKKVKKRASLLSIFLLLSVIGVFLILNALNKNILYFNSPTDIKISQDINYNKKIAYITEEEIKSHKDFLKKELKKNFY